MILKNRGSSRLQVGFVERKYPIANRRAILTPLRAVGFCFGEHNLALQGGFFSIANRKDGQRLEFHRGREDHETKFRYGNLKSLFSL
jgi:hypothetical protein